MHDIFCMHIGQCGLQIGFALWELLTAEHGIRRDGKMDNDNVDDKLSYSTFFNLSLAGQYVPRSIFVDLEPTVIDQMRTGSFRQLYHPNQLINGNEDAANNFARGFHTVGRIMKRSCENRIRKEFEVNDSIQGIHIYRSLGGGTGSGMTATLFESLLEYPKISKVEIPIHPSPHLSCAIVEPYNCILSEHFCMDDVDISILIDNESLYDIMMEQIGVKEPILHHINRLIAQVCSSLTASSRFENELYNDFSVLTNLVPYPRIHFPLVSYAPFGSESKIARDTNTVSQLTHAVFDSSNQLVKCDPISGKYMSCSLVYRGEISPTQVFSALSEIKGNRFVRFVDWCPTGFKVGIVNQPPQVLPDSKIGYSTKNVVMMTNSSSVSALWHRLAQKFHKLYAKRSFVHWFVSEGLEENEFCESLYNLATLAKDYEEVALDTKSSEAVDITTSPDKEILSTEKQENEASSPKTKTSKEESQEDEEENNDEDEGEDENDDEYDENENASNALNLNTNQPINWKDKFENLILSIQKTYKRTKFSSDPVVFTEETNEQKCLSFENEILKQLKIKRKILCDTNKQNQQIKNQIFEQDSIKIDINNKESSNFDDNKRILSNGISENQSIDTLNVISIKDSQEILALCSPHPSLNINSQPINNENCRISEHENQDDEKTTFSLMESLVRLTSSQ